MLDGLFASATLMSYLSGKSVKHCWCKYARSKSKQALFC